MGKNCALGLEYGLGPYSRPRAQFFPIRTSRPVNNIYFLCISMSSCKVNFEQISYHILTRESRCLVKSVFMKDQVIMLIKLVSMEDQVVMLG